MISLGLVFGLALISICITFSQWERKRVSREVIPSREVCVVRHSENVTVANAALNPIRRLPVSQIIDFRWGYSDRREERMVNLGKTLTRQQHRWIIPISVVFAELDWWRIVADWHPREENNVTKESKRWAGIFKTVVNFQLVSKIGAASIIKGLPFGVWHSDLSTLSNLESIGALPSRNSLMFNRLQGFPGDERGDQNRSILNPSRPIHRAPVAFWFNVARLILACLSIFVGGWLVFGDVNALHRVRAGFVLLFIGLVLGNGFNW